MSTMASRAYSRADLPAHGSSAHSITARFSNRCVVPLPTMVGSERWPGMNSPSPLTLTPTGRVSSTCTIRASSPGTTISGASEAMWPFLSSASTTFTSSSRSTVSTPSARDVPRPKTRLRIEK